MNITEEQSQSLKLFVVLSKAYRELLESTEAEIKNRDLSGTEFAILELLYHKGKIPLQQIGSKILISSANITYNVDKLEKKGYLKRELSTEDRRVTYAVITEAGTEVMEDVFPKHAQAMYDATSGLSVEEKTTAIELLKKLGISARV
ncbi:MarR family winged helix-turn-helix transcriptional regulator [Paenibacillus aestuarii]|uniref:MarR family winged helix-turn-helix transcriptional regulator n=1 Tax=Paenibacillus aestuarii TaxID=516965 RepID=A0ABW0K989_9BACL|nr:MarR family transcriptional regulator [Paenibacillus aestuarii]